MAGHRPGPSVVAWAAKATVLAVKRNSEPRAADEAPLSDAPSYDRQQIARRVAGGRGAFLPPRSRSAGREQAPGHCRRKSRPACGVGQIARARQRVATNVAMKLSPCPALGSPATARSRMAGSSPAMTWPRVPRVGDVVSGGPGPSVGGRSRDAEPIPNHDELVGRRPRPPRPLNRPNPPLYRSHSVRELLLRAV